MELVGNETKIQTLFRELRLEDEPGVPEFASLWNRAQATSPGPRRVIKISFAVATVLLVITLGSLALWSQNWQRGQLPNQSVAGGSATPGPTLAPAPVVPEPKQLVTSGPRNRVRSNHWARRLAAHRRAELAARHAAMLEAVAIATWQSPTATFMESPADDVLTSLPQLDRSVNELKSFLPNTPK